MPDKPQRRLAAIFVLDVAGFSRMMAEDESGTLDRVLAQQRDIIAPLIRDGGGRVVKLMGDGVLAVFPSVIAAVESAAAIQARAGAAAGAERMQLRIGINLGEVIVTQGDVYGDGVNVAARLEALARPGGVALSAAAYEQVRNKIPFGFEDFGLHEVKNIPEPVQVYFLGEELTSLPSLRQPAPVAPAAPAPAAAAAPVQPAPAGPRPFRWVLGAVLAAGIAAAAGVAWWGLQRPGGAGGGSSQAAAAAGPVIALLPFTPAAPDSGGSPPPEGQEGQGLGISAGLSSSLADQLAAVPGLIVIAPHSSFAVADQPAGEAARVLGADYLVAGRVARSDEWGLILEIHDMGQAPGGVLRLPARPQPGPRALQAAAAADLLGYLGIPQPEGGAWQPGSRSIGAGSGGDQAYLMYLAARQLADSGARDKAVQVLEQLLAADGGLVPARVLMGRLALDMLADPVAAVPARAARAAEWVAGMEGPSGALQLQAVAQAFSGSIARAQKLAAAAVAAAPSSADANLTLAWVQALSGPDGAAGAQDALAVARRSDPVMPPRYHQVQAEAEFAAASSTGVLEATARVLALRPLSSRALLLRSAELANAGRFSEAEEAMQQVLLQEPGLTLAQAAAAFPFADAAVQARLLGGLRLAGLADAQ